MTNGQSAPKREISPQERLEWTLQRARLAIAAGRIWMALWPPLAVLLVFLTLSLFGLWPLLPRDWHKNLLIAFGAAFVLSWLPLLRLRWPGRDEAIARVEALSKLKHRPVSSFEDTLANNSDPASAALWQAHKERLTRFFNSLKAGWPDPRVDRKDPIALRALLILLFIVALTAHGDDFSERLKAAFDVKPAGTAGQNMRIDVWITPPSYTGRPPVMLTGAPRTMLAANEKQAPVEAPENSELVIRINHPKASSFRVTLNSDNPSGRKALEANAEVSGNDVAEFRDKITASGTLNIAGPDGNAGHWQFNVIEDKPPSITLTEPVSLSYRGSLHLKYHVEDDYGVASARALINEVKDIDSNAEAKGQDNASGDESGTPVKRLGEPPVIPLSLPRAALKSGDGQTFKDLTSHPWAGLPVSLTLVAEDQAGQVGGSDGGRFILPERQFKKPLARALIEQRKALVNRPDEPQRVADAIDALTIAPEYFTQDKGLYLGLRSVYWRLHNAAGTEDVESAVSQLWDIALKIEDGDLPEAERQLREAQEKLAKALDENAPEEEIKKLMDELRTALGRFLEAMQQKADKGEKASTQPGPNEQITQQDLDKMLKDIENLARTGSRDAARQLLSELQQMLENARTANSQPSGEQQDMMNTIDQLSNMMMRQQQLLDETFRGGRDGEGRENRDENSKAQGQRGGIQQGQRQQGRGQGQGQQDQLGRPSLGDLQKRQQALQRELNELMKGMQGANGDVRQKLEEAERAMSEASDLLGRQEREAASQEQGQAVDNLRAGAKSLAEQMMQAQQQGQQGMRGTQGGNSPFDPLGRPNRTHGADTGDSVKVPDEIDILRAREILDELRRRLGERYRPEMELEYLDRLIKRF